jgi:hypothetical protein
MTTDPRDMVGRNPTGQSRRSSGRTRRKADRRLTREIENMPKLRKGGPVKCRPGEADFCLAVIVDRGTDALADGEDYLYFQSGEIPDEDEWHEIADAYAAGDELLEFTAKATEHGRHWGSDPRETEHTWSAPGPTGR